MHIRIEYKTDDGDVKYHGIDNVHGGRPLAENVRQAFESVPTEAAYVVAVYVDGESRL